MHMRWRAIVHADRDHVLTAWHVAACSSPEDAAAHCVEGRRLLLDNGGDPDGHCLIDGKCARGD
jgi:hypothetical protein